MHVQIYGSHDSPKHQKNSADSSSTRSIGIIYANNSVQVFYSVSVFGNKSHRYVKEGFYQ